MTRPRLFWLWSRLFPELDLLGTRRLAWQGYSRAMFRSVSGPLILVLVMGGPLLFMLVDPRSDTRDWSFAAIMLLWLLVPLVCFLLIRNRLRRRLRQELVKIGVPICIQCAYDLRGQIEPRCPECGEPFVLADLTSAQLQPAESTNSLDDADKTS